MIDELSKLSSSFALVLALFNQLALANKVFDMSKHVFLEV